MKPDYIENLTDEVNAAVEKVHDAFIKKVIKKHALPLLNKFQAKISFPVEILYCNGDFWLSEREKTNDFHDLLQDLALGNGNPRNAYEKQIAETFPEMIELYQLYYEFNGYHGRPLLADLKPTVKPRKNQKTALDKKLEYFSED